MPNNIVWLQYLKLVPADQNETGWFKMVILCTYPSFP